MSSSIVKEMYLIRDRVSKIYAEFPFPAFNKADAIRGFENYLKRKVVPEGGNPEDYELYFVGLYDRVVGSIHGTDGYNPEFIIGGKDFDYGSEVKK